MARLGYQIPSLPQPIQAEVDPLSNIRFMLKDRDNHEFIHAKLEEFQRHPDLYKCEWIATMIADNGDPGLTGSFWYLYDDAHLYAAISNDEPEMQNGMQFYYSSISCSFERVSIPGRPELSSGRVMRAFNLARVFLETGGGSFMYWGMVIPTAVDFNLAVGSRTLDNYVNVNSVVPTMLDYFQTKLREPTLTLEELILNRIPFNAARGNLLFFYADARKLSGRLVTAYNIIQYLLPPSKKLAQPVQAPRQPFQVPTFNRSGGYRKRKRRTKRNAVRRRF